MKRELWPYLIIIGLASSNAFGAVSDDDLNELRQQLAAMSQRLDSLADENAELRQKLTATTVAVAKVAEARPAPAPSASDSWPDRIKLAGDFRYRYEDIDVEGSSSRQRNRIRARSNITATVADNIDVGFGLATGGDDPVSSNQTLGGGGSSKSIALDLAYADWKINDQWQLVGGKFKNPLTRVGGQGLLWDGDWRPEGFAVSYKNDSFFVNAIGTFLESDSRNSNDNFSWGATLGGTTSFAGASVTGGIAYYAIKTKGDGTTFGDPADAGDYFGNTAIETGGLACGTTPGVDCVYLYDYLLTEVFAEASFELGDRPASVFFDYVKNSDASANDTGWAAGAKFGQAKDTGQMQLSYLYADKEADSTLGLLSDSDFGGGGTDTRGHFLKLDYGVNKNWTISAQYYINETGFSSGSKSDYNRLMLDTQWKWK